MACEQVLLGHLFSGGFSLPGFGLNSLLSLLHLPFSFSALDGFHSKIASNMNAGQTPFLRSGKDSFGLCSGQRVPVRYLPASASTQGLCKY